MKRFVLLFLIVNLLASNLPSSLVVSVFELGNLVEHYQTHRSASPDYGFLAFLADHYSENAHRESDARHENLPFHHHHHDDCCQFAAQSPVFLPPVFVAAFFEKMPDPVTEKPVAKPELVVVSAFAGKIWQPPKG